MEYTTLLYDNVTNMIDLLTETKDLSLEEAYKLLHISGSSHLRWKTNDNTKQNTLQDLYNQYSLLFTPPLQESLDLKKTKILNMALKNQVLQKITDRFIGLYYIYYFSDHYRDEIHGGMLKLYNHGSSIYAKIVIGIRDISLLDDESFLSLFSTDDDALDSFILFKDSLQYYIDKRCYYYSGHATINKTLLTLHMTGTEQRHDHTHIAMFDLQRISAGIDRKTGNIRNYKGGLGIVVSPPNSHHRSMRIYRMGISRWKIDYNNPELRTLLKHNITDYNRVTVTEDNDRRWFDLMVLYERDYLS